MICLGLRPRPIILRVLYAHNCLQPGLYPRCTYHISIINNSENTFITYIHTLICTQTYLYSGLSSFIMTSLKVGIVGILAIIVLYFLASGIISVFTKSNRTGGEFNEGLSTIIIMCIELSNQSSIIVLYVCLYYIKQSNVEQSFKNIGLY